MKKIFSDEVAQELGYQKYWPEKSDWTIATLGIFAVFVILFGVLFWIFGK